MLTLTAPFSKNILNAKEEEYQEGFVRDLFVTVFGYTLNPQPDYNFVLEKKTEADSTKSDDFRIIHVSSTLWSLVIPKR